MRGWCWAACLALGATLGCGTGRVDYSELKSAADARWQRASSLSVAGERSVAELLRHPLNAEAAARLALLNNRGARALAEESNIARANLVGARRLPNPTVHGAMVFHGGETPELEFDVMLSVTDLVLLAARAGAAEAGAEAARLTAVGELIDLAFEARRAFFDYQAALHALELRRSVVAATDASADAAQRLRAAGNITELALANERSLLAEARLSLQSSEVTAAAARERLNALMGLWGRDIEWQADGRLPEPPSQELALKQLEVDSIRSSLDLEIAKQGYAAAAKSANVARAAGLVPQLRAGVAAERQDSWGVGPAVELELPLFYQGQGERGVAEAQRRQREDRYADTAVRVRSSARTLSTQLAAARARVLYVRDVLLPLKQKVLEETQLQYNAMLVGVFQLLEVRRTQIEATASYVDQLRDYWRVRTSAEQLLAGRLPEPRPEAAPSHAELSSSTPSGPARH